ncbi:MAG: RNA pyrophosphohydrolase [Anaerolineae bacterium]|jgi:putative (di)nucleoside polyphosphate hydrolase|nr:RNA pyrophosphohydrolase [Anaerolineae bacterium]MBT7782827.1 RNA pyrophosphohydrolase [Anaerolineae bacterium]
MTKKKTQTFRAGVGALILNKDGLVLGFERKDFPNEWQFPQGGLDEGEDLLEAVKREIYEETGIKASDIKLLAKAPRPTVYEFPNKSPHRGQVHHWFLFRLESSDEAITLGDQKEFHAWKWVSMDEMIENVVSFKKPVYKEVAKDFEAYLA